MVGVWLYYFVLVVMAIACQRGKKFSLEIFNDIAVKKTEAVHETKIHKMTLHGTAKNDFVWRT